MAVVHYCQSLFSQALPDSTNDFKKEGGQASEHKKLSNFIFSFVLKNGRLLSNFILKGQRLLSENS